MSVLSNPEQFGVEVRARRREEPVRLFERYQRERQIADRDELVARFMPLAQHLGRRYSARAEEDDLQQVAALGLVKAIERFDPTRGIAFSSFAVPTILGSSDSTSATSAGRAPPRHVEELALRVDAVAEKMTGALGRSPTVRRDRRRLLRDIRGRARSARGQYRALPRFARRAGEDDGDETRERLVGGEDPGFARAEQAADLERLFWCLSERERAGGCACASARTSCSRRSAHEWGSLRCTSPSAPHGKRSRPSSNTLPNGGTTNKRPKGY